MGWECVFVSRRASVRFFVYSKKRRGRIRPFFLYLSFPPPSETRQKPEPRHIHKQNTSEMSAKYIAKSGEHESDERRTLSVIELTPEVGQKIAFGKFACRSDDRRILGEHETAVVYAKITGRFLYGAPCIAVEARKHTVDTFRDPSKRVTPPGLFTGEPMRFRIGLSWLKEFELALFGDAIFALTLMSIHTVAEVIPEMVDLYGWVAVHPAKNENRSLRKKRKDGAVDRIEIPLYAMAIHPCHHPTLSARYMVAVRQGEEDDADADVEPEEDAEEKTGTERVNPRDGAIEEKKSQQAKPEEYAVVGAFWEDALLTGVFTRIDEARIAHERRPMDDSTSVSGNGSAELTVQGGKNLRYEVVRDTLSAFDGDVSGVMEILANMSTRKDAIDENAKVATNDPVPVTTADETGEATVDPIMSEEVDGDGEWVATKTVNT